MSRYREMVYLSFRTVQESKLSLGLKELLLICVWGGVTQDGYLQVEFTCSFSPFMLIRDRMLIFLRKRSRK